MSLAYLFPVLIGAATILQGTLNRKIGQSMGIAQVTVYSNFFTLLYSVLFLFAIKYLGTSKESFFYPKGTLFQFEWWYLIPAIFGCLIVLGIPYSINSLGALRVTMIMVITQILVSLIWDWKMEAIVPNLTKILAVIFGVASVVLVTFEKK